MFCLLIGAIAAAPSGGRAEPTAGDNDGGGEKTGVEEETTRRAVRLNSVGFLPGAPKQATVAAEGNAGVALVRRVDDGTVVWRGETGAPIVVPPAEVDEVVRVVDFSDVREPGRYVLEAPGGQRSAEFEIGAGVWREPFELVTRAFYLWRCGTAVEGEWKGTTYKQTACHLHDGWLDYVGNEGVHREGTGGWHDAGDYNKYVVNAGVTVGLMFKAWEHFREGIEGVKLNLPESGNGVPDLLNELRWELDWLLKMQLPDGRVYHKLSALNFSYWGPAGEDESKRYFAGWSSTATADFAAMMALAARHFEEFDAAFAETCLAAARLSWDFLAAHPEHVAPEQAAFSTGGYTAPDAGHRLWAAAELWVTTGEAKYLEDFEQRAEEMHFTRMGPSWADVRDLALGTYLEHAAPARDAALVRRLESELRETVTGIVATAADNAYGRPLGGTRETWFWGANGAVAAQTYLLHVADRRWPDPAYRAAAQQALAFLFGRNAHGRSYVTGLGDAPPQHPHDRRGEPAWPGYLVGGGWPTGLSWKDEMADYRQNEIAMNWNASLLYALAAFVEPDAAQASGAQ